MRYLVSNFIFIPLAVVGCTAAIAKEPKLDFAFQSRTTGILKVENHFVSVSLANQEETGVPVRGKVLSFDGKPVPGAIVRLNRREPGMGGFHGSLIDVQTNEVTTNEAGEYEFVGVDPSWPYRIVTQTRIAAEGNLLIPDDGSLSRGNKQFDITLKQPVTVRGIVTDEDGQPLSDVRVSSRTYTDAEGRFSIVLAADTKEYQVDLYRKGYVSTSENTKPDELNAHEWKLMMYRQASLEVTGRAIFVDGTPVSDTRLELEVAPINAVERTHARQIAGQTDDNGNFTITIPQPMRYAGIAKALENRPDEGRQWWCEVQNIQLAQPLNLTFDNRGQIHVDIKKTKLPGAYKFSVSCYQVKSHRSMMSEELPDDESSLVLTGLEPGEYLVHLCVPKLSNERWIETVTIPDRAPFHARVTLAPPKFETGDIKATFLMPDGKTPASELGVYLEGVGAGRSAITNAIGELHVKDLIAGSFYLSPRHLRGEVAEVGISGYKVIAGQETDLGTIRLKSMDEEFGWFEGSLTYDDGVAVPAMLIDSTRIFPGGGIRIKSDGQFRYQFRHGKQNVVFAFRDKGVASFPASVPQPLFKYSTQLVVPVEIDAGKTVSRKLVLKQSGTRKPVTVTWSNPMPTPAYMKAIVEQDDFHWVQNAECTNTASSAEFTQLPGEGQCIIVARTCQPEFFFVKRVPFESPDQNVEFNPGEAGSIAVSVADATGNPVRAFGLQLTTEIVGITYYVINLPIAADKDSRLVSYDRMYRQREDGTIVISGIGPGNYHLKVTDGNRRQERNVTVVTGKESIVDMQLR